MTQAVENTPDPISNGRILLADDEEALRDVLSSILSRYGYEVVACADGQEALNTFKQSPKSFNIIILDTVMPHMGGPTAARAIRESSEIPILLMSGYDIQQTRPLVDGISHISFCQKPFQLKHLMQTVSSLIQETFHEHGSQPSTTPI